MPLAEISLLVAEAVKQRGRQHHSRTTPYDGLEELRLFGHKAYSSATLQFGITNSEALMAKYIYTNYSKISELIYFLPKDKKEQFEVTISEGHLLARTALEASLDSADTAARSIVTSMIMQ